MNANTHDAYDDNTTDPGGLEERLQRIEGELEDHLPEDQRLQSSIPDGRGRSDFVGPTVHKAVYEEPRRRPEPRQGRPAEPSFADFYEPGVADVDADEVLGRDRRPPARPTAPPARKNRSLDSLRQILADLGAASEAAPGPDTAKAVEPVDAGMDEGLLELQPDELVETAEPEDRRRTAFLPVETDFLRQSGLLDTSRNAIRPPAAPPEPPVPAELEELKDRLEDLPLPVPSGDLDKALAMARSLEKTVPKPAPSAPHPDLEAVQAYLETLHGQIKASPEPVVAPPPAASEPKRPVFLIVAATILGTTLFLVLLYAAYLFRTGALRFD
jgi:hypothetical protein